MKLQRINSPNLINKDYSFYKRRTIKSASLFVGDLACASYGVFKKNSLITLLCYVASCLSLKCANYNYKMMKQLKPEYKAIVARAKKIYG